MVVVQEDGAEPASAPDERPDVEEKEENGEWGTTISENDSMYYRHLLIEYAQNCNSEGVLDILEKGKSIPKIYDSKDSDIQYSVLHHAAFRGHFEICKILIDAGCDIYAIDKFGKTAVHLAIQKGYDKIAIFMLDKTHPLNFPRTAKLSLVQLASAYGRPQILKILAARGGEDQSVETREEEESEMLLLLLLLRLRSEMRSCIRSALYTIIFRHINFYSFISSRRRFLNTLFQPTSTKGTLSVRLRSTLQPRTTACPA